VNATSAISLSIIIPTLGRRTLSRTLRSISSQDAFGDDVEVIVVGDGPRPAARAQFEREAVKHPNWTYLEHGPQPGWGHAQRMAGLERARGRYVMFINDDDGYAPGALATIRQAMVEHPGRVVIFKMDRIGILYWRRPEIRQGDVSVQMYLVPNVAEKVGSMTNPIRYESDFDFIVQTLELQGTEPVWRDEIIVIADQADWWPGTRKKSTELTRKLDRIRIKLRVRTRVKALRSR
jgi:glycosyltransferase involved in cell wall biosynthesis